MRPLHLRVVPWSLAAALLLGAAAWLGYQRHARPSLPYRDSFARNSAAEWGPMGGDWQIRDGVVYNRSDEHGAKLLTGSPKWADYQLVSDLKLIGHEGDVGVMLRVGDEEPGVDSYNGYYIGLRSDDSAIVMGRADHGWMEGRPVAMEGGVQTGVWYRLRVVIVGCDIGAQITNLGTGQVSWSAFHEDDCVRHGKIGLRSMATGAAWKNIAVTPATRADYKAIRKHAAFVETPIYPLREDDYSRMRESYFRSTIVPARSFRTTGLKDSFVRSDEKPVSIESVKAAPSTQSSIVLRGVVTFTSPLYLQDSTGGIEVRLAEPVALNLGDEIEVRGTSEVEGNTTLFHADDMHLRGDRTLVVPVSVTSTQAAEGTFDGRLVELSGILRSKKMGEEDRLTLQMEDAEQSFRVTGNGGLSLRQYKRWIPGSRLRVRGICIVGPGRQPDAGSFTILLRSLDDVEVLEGPPWWSPRIIIRYILLFALLVKLGVYLYLRIERWKMRAILEERERLAHEMHDTLAQSFAGVGFHLQGVRNRLRSGSMDMPAVIGNLDVACDMVTRTHREASAEIAALHSHGHEKRDVLTALEHCMHTMLAENLPAVSLVREGTPRTLTMTLRDTLFQVGRESLTNILRHSRATEIQMALRYKANCVILEIADNGCGFEYDHHADGFGIRGMQRRSRKANAILNIETLPGKGTRVRIEAPYGLRLTPAGWLRSQQARRKNAF